MLTCQTCHHDDVVHQNFVGCCGHQGCLCAGMDGAGRCVDHGSVCWWAVPRVKPQMNQIKIKLVARGNGYRYEVVVRGETIKVHRRAVTAVRWVKDVYGFDLPAPPSKPC